MEKQPRTIAVIDVGNCRTDDAHLVASRFAARRLGGQTLTQRIVRRLSDATRIDHVVVTGAHLPAGLLTAGIAGAEVLELPYGHVCERLAAATDSFNADWVVYVPGNRPFVDPVLIDCLLNRAYQSTTELDYVGFYGSGDGWQQVRRLGLAGEVVHGDALRRLRRNVERLSCDPSELSLAGWLQDAPGTYQMKFVSIPDALDREDLRFAIEDESDWEYAELFSDHVRNDLTEWQLLAELVRDNRDVREVMAHRNSVR